MGERTEDKKQLIASWLALPADLRKRIPNSAAVEAIITEWQREAKG